MRFLVTVHLPIDAANAFLREPGYAEKIGEILASQQAESTYFPLEHGIRKVIYVTRVTDDAQMATIAEPWWLLFKSEIDVDVIPVMSAEELHAAGPHIAELNKKYRTPTPPPASFGSGH